MFCAGATGKGPCDGDDGGGFVQRLDDGDGMLDYIVGVSSWGYQCGLPDVPRVFARVSAVKEWIISWLVNSDP